MEQSVGNITDSNVSNVNLNNEKIKSTVQNKSYRCKVKPWQIILNAVTLLNLAINIICICRMFPRSSNLSIDYLGLIVGILGLLVTVLIGWNIFYALELKKDLILKMQEKQNETSNQLSDYAKKVQKDFDNIDSSIKNLEERTQNINKSLIDILKATSVFNYSEANNHINRTKETLIQGMHKSK